MENNKSNWIVGGIFVIIGILLFASRLDFFDFGNIISNFWALIFVVLPGLIFHYAFFQGGKKSPGLLVPGGILLFTGLTLQISYTFDAWEILWPGYIMAVALALYELYMFGRQEKGLLIPVAILGGLSIVFFATISINQLFDYNMRTLVLPIIFIIAGFAIIFGRRAKE